MSGSGKLVVKNGGYKFLDSYIWSTIHDNVGFTLIASAKKKQAKFWNQ